MTTPKKLSWPTALVLCIAILAIAVTILFGPALGLDPELLTSVLGAQGVLAALVLGVMRQLLGADTSEQLDEIERKRAERIRTRIPPTGGAGLAIALIIVAAALSVVTSGCNGVAGVAAAGSTAVTVRDVGCRGGRMVCRWTDRACRLTGGPWVVPRSAEEIATDAASGSTSSPMVPTVEVEDEPAEGAGE